MIPEKLSSLNAAEDALRAKALELIADDPRLGLHLTIVEHAMDVADQFRQSPINDEDGKAIQLLSMRTFNALAASVKLALSGYFQNSALLMRDVLETVFLIDFFRGEPAAVCRWRHAGKKERMRRFSPLRIREALDARDGFTKKKRFEMYEMFSELAGHPTMKSVHMMRPRMDGDAVIGPFMKATALRAVLSEMGRLAVQVGELVSAAHAVYDDRGAGTRVEFTRVKLRWLGDLRCRAGHQSALIKSSSTAL